ncbi:hypothetical protein M409DRAFT_61843 [Zasmidium cellare ATCC 36951]|uniref:Uncharacterized protein n=1 Tax=Zasmidium cellare ATCC 36951 TaxID=1080233 RepID=A0A6A6D5D6_ZASCE|nr:uncharacterized protein M409DRAFT_61843 [Zasmidium cellare ATCC 36951]KAF2173432.1 hypothetical protein M409DRAFT_61843 [Zasmidium cellare ATCC 36951]
MAGTRSSARQAEKNSSPQSAEKSGAKRKAGDSAPTEAKNDRPSKGQKTLEETMQPSEDVDEGVDETFDEEMRQAEADATGNKKEEETNDEKKAEGSNGSKKEDEGNALEKVKADEKDAGRTSKPEESKETANGDTKGTAVKEDKQREKAQPSNILEKGIIYFFTRGRVGVDDPDSVQNLQRTFFVLRPLPDGAKLTEGAIQDVGNNRLIALPKKVFPKSGKDRFMAFVEKGKTSMDELKESFFTGSEYSTKTTGTRHTPEVTPLGEGVYAMTSTGEGRTTTHLAYMLTIPMEIGEVQKDVGIADKGSFVLSLKNPEASGPANAQLPQKPEFPKEFIDEFQGRGWMPIEPKHLDYANAQMLLIGESFDSGSALEANPNDEKKEEKEVPQEELEKLEEEDEHRIENLKGDDTIFEDLGISSKEYPKVKSTW